MGGESWRVLRGNSGLAAFPLIGALVILVAVLPPAAVGCLLIDRADTVPGALLLALAVYLASFVTAFFGVALAASADQALRGEPASLGHGIGVARTRLGAIAGWALVNATVSLILRALEQRSELAAIAAALVGGAWAVLTLLVLPLVALEGLGPVAAVKRSSSLFKAHWGDQFRGLVSVGIRVLPFTLGSILLIAAGGYLLTQEGADGRVAGVVLTGFGAVALAISAWIGSTLRQVFAVVLYRFALDGTVVGGFSADELENSVRFKRTRGHARTA